MKITNQKRNFAIEGTQTISDCIEYVETVLTGMKVPKKLIVRSCLVVEEALVELLAQKKAEGEVRIQIRRLFGDASIMISVPGEEYDPYWGNMKFTETDAFDAEEDEERDRAIRAILLKSYGEDLKFSYKGEKNRVRIMVGLEGQSMLKKTFIGLLLGIAFGLLLKLLIPQAGVEAVSTYFLTPVKTMFMHALQIVIAPVVFFSIVACIAQFKDLSELGRIGVRVMGLYFLTTIIAVTVAMAAFSIATPGEPGFALGMTLDESAVASVPSTDVDTSLLSTIVNIIPSNFLRPFLEANTLQIIFLAVIVGIAVGMIGEHAAFLKKFFDACNSLFLTLTTMITKFIPLAVFCSLSLLVLMMDGKSFLALFGASGTILATVFVMIMVYGLLILILAHLNPFTFFKKNRNGMLTSFTLSSSSAAMPTNMDICVNKLGISPKVSSFSIPLGATVNMDGTTIALTIFSLFLARAYGVEITPSTLLSLSVTIILLALGTPGVPGAGLVCVGVLLTQLHVPVEAIGMIIGIYPFVEMFTTMSNTTGDVAVSLIVAKQEKLLDLEMYNSKEKKKAS
jgi:Na+/H+-dicarboxylate symporter